MRRCLVTGARGFIGRHLVNHLRERHVKVISTSKSSDGLDTGRNCYPVYHGFDAVPPEALEEVDIVFHLANVAHTQLSADDQSLYWQINVKGTQDLLDVAIQAGVKTFVYVSSVKARGQPIDGYGQSKSQAEQLVLRYGREHGLHVVVIRPCLVYGPGVKGNLDSMITGIVQRRLPWAWFCLPEFGNIRSMVSVQDVVQALVLLASDVSSSGQIFTLSDGQPYTPYKLQNAIYQAAGLSRPFLEIPKWLFAIAASLGQSVQTMIGRNLPFNRAVFVKLAESARYEASESLVRLGWQPQHTFYSQLPAMISELSNEIE